MSPAFAKASARQAPLAKASARQAPFAKASAGRAADPGRPPLGPSPRREREQRWRRRTRLAVLFVATLLLANAVVGDNGLVELWRLRAQTATLQAEVEWLRLERARLSDEARRLREDRATIEAVARRELGLVRAGERIVLVPR